MKTCPFCGYEHPHIKVKKHYIGIGYYGAKYKNMYSVRCGRCHGRGPLTNNEQTAIEGWNGKEN